MTLNKETSGQILPSVGFAKGGRKQALRTNLRTKGFSIKKLVKFQNLHTQSTDA